MPKPMRDKIYHLWITSNDHFTKQIHLFSNQKIFGCYTSMIICIQNSCVFLWVANFSGSHRRLRTPSYTFMGFHRWIHMYKKKYWVFHSRGYLSLLAFIRHIFSFTCMQPCDFVRCRPIILSPPSNTKRSVDPYHALTPISCDVPVHMQCDVPLHAYTMSHI